MYWHRSDVSYLLILFLFPTSICVGESSEVASAFLAYEIVPDVLLKPPKKLLKVTYAGGLNVDKGTVLTPVQVKQAPNVEYNATPSSHYTLIMIDPDVTSRANPDQREIEHWLVTNIPGSNVQKGKILAAYLGSAPGRNTGLHRYVFLLYKQPRKLEFDEPYIANNSAEGRPYFKAAKFAKKYGFGNPLAGNFFQAEWDEYAATVQEELGIVN